MLPVFTFTENELQRAKDWLMGKAEFVHFMAIRKRRFSPVSKVQRKCNELNRLNRIQPVIEVNY
jgi:hypothetical protein